MKTLKNTWLRASIITAIVACVFVTLNAMKKAAPQQVEPALFVWYYVEGEATEASSYQRTAVTACDNFKEVICQILAPEDNFSPHLPHISELAKLDIREALTGEMYTNETVIAFRQE